MPLTATPVNLNKNAVGRFLFDMGKYPVLIW